MPFKRPTTSTATDRTDKDTTRVNDSFNASKIVSSLVEANKGRIISNINNPKGKKSEAFEKLEEFKLFPKHKNSSQYEPNKGVSPINLTSSGGITKPYAVTSRSDTDCPKFGFSSTAKHTERDKVARSVKFEESGQGDKQTEEEPT
jgi:hypothetical protein